MHRLTLGTLDNFFARLVAKNPCEVGRRLSIFSLSAGASAARDYPRPRTYHAYHKFVTNSYVYTEWSCVF